MFYFATISPQAVLTVCVYLVSPSHPESYNLVWFLARVSRLLAMLCSRGLASERLPREEMSLNKKLCKNCSLIIISHTLIEITFKFIINSNNCHNYYLFMVSHITEIIISSYYFQCYLQLIIRWLNLIGINSFPHRKSKGSKALNHIHSCYIQPVLTKCLLNTYLP